MAKRQRTRSGFNWKTNVGGMPVWGITVTLAVIVGIFGVVAIAPLIRGDANATPYVRPSDAFDYSTPSPTAEPRVSIPTDRPLEVFFAGDSLTQGSYATADALMFRNLVAARLGELATTNAAVVGAPGQTVNEAAQYAETAPTKADVSIVEYGTNDSIRSTVEAFTADYPAYLDRVRAVSPDSTLVCVGAWGDPQITDPFDQVITDACAARAGIFVATSDLFIKESLRAMTGDVLPSGFTVPDNFHPNDAGHQAIADRITAALLG